MADTTRRGFLGVMAAAPLAARAAVAQEASGMSVLGLQAREAGMPCEPVGSSSYAQAMRSLVRTGIPDWKRQEMRQRAASRARVLDPDIANLQSVSLAGKYRMQCDRNYQRAVAELSTEGILDEARNAFFQKLHGD